MAEPSNAAPADENPGAERRRLLVKAVLAGTGVLGLIVALIMVDGSRERQEEPAPTAHAVTPLTVPSEQSQSIAEAAQQALKTSNEAAQIQSVVMAEQESVAQSAAPPVPEETADPTVTAPRPAPAGKRNEGTGRLVLEQSPPKSGRGTASTTAVAQASVSPPRAAAVTSSAAPANFMVQLGVFTNRDNAEQLSSRLKSAGIPSQVETRVQIGPFKTREEALAAQEKLKTLGLATGMIVPGHR